MSSTAWRSWASGVVMGCAGLAGCPAKDADVRLSPTQIAERSKPATVEVIVRYVTKVEVVHLDIDTERLKAEVLHELSGTDPSESQVYEKFFNVFYTDPEKYLRQGGDIRHLTEKIYALGSGFIVTPDGYVVTNAHVVAPEEDELKKAAIASVTGLVDEDTRQMEQVLAKLLPGETIKPAATERLRKTLAEQYAKTANFDFDSDIHLLLPAAHGDSADASDVRRCELKQIGKPVPGEDVAILKMEGTDLPTLPLAASIASGSVHTGDDLYVLGYPGTVALDAGFTENSRMQPSLTTGHVSGIKDMTGGWNAIQTEAPINPGNSGGPVLNGRGEVVGLATFGEKESQGLNFAVSVDLARKYLDKQHVRPRESGFTHNYNLALAQYDRPGHGRALKMFRELSDSHPEIGGPREYVAELGQGQPPPTRTTNTEPAKEPAKSREPERASEPEQVAETEHRGLHIPPAALILGGVGLLLASGIGVVILANRR